MDRTATVQEVMDREFVGASESDTVRDAAELMLGEGCESVVVLRGGEPVGVVSQRDALAALVADAGDQPVTDAMTTDVPTVPPEATIGEAASEMSAQATGRLVVTDGDRTVGVLSEHDLMSTAPFAQVAGVGGGAEPGSELPSETAAVAGFEDRAGENAADTFEDQSICEACGSFARDLATFNGQLLCGDCRDI